MLCPPPLPIPLKIMLPWPILKIPLLHLIGIPTSKGRGLMRHVHGWRRRLRIEAIRWMKLGWRESRVRGVIRVPTILISPKLLSTPTAYASTPNCPTSHTLLQNLKKRLVLTFAPNLNGECADLRIRTENVSGLNRMQITSTERLGLPEI
jgi:hypothetical protein